MLTSVSPPYYLLDSFVHKSHWVRNIGSLVWVKPQRHNAVIIEALWCHVLTPVSRHILGSLVQVSLTQNFGVSENAEAWRSDHLSTVMSYFDASKPPYTWQLPASLTDSVGVRTQERGPQEGASLCIDYLWQYFAGVDLWRIAIIDDVFSLGAPPLFRPTFFLYMFLSSQARDASPFCTDSNTDKDTAMLYGDRQKLCVCRQLTRNGVRNCVCL